MVKWRKKKGRTKLDRGKERVGWQRGNKNERVRMGRETDGTHRGSREMESARQTEQGVDEGAVDLEKKRGPCRQ